MLLSCLFYLVLVLLALSVCWCVFCSKNYIVALIRSCRCFDRNFFLIGGVLSYIGSTLQQTPEMLEEASGCTPEEVGLMRLFVVPLPCSNVAGAREGRREKGS